MIDGDAPDQPAEPETRVVRLRGDAWEAVKAALRLAEEAALHHEADKRREHEPDLVEVRLLAACERAKKLLAPNL